MHLFKPITAINSSIERIGLDGYIPYKFINLCLEMSWSKLMGENKIYKTTFKDSLYKLIQDTNITLWIDDTIRFVKRVGENYNLRLIEEVVEKELYNKALSSIGNSFNYVFDLSKISNETKRLLNITDDQETEISKLDDEVINILTITSGYGSCIKPSKTLEVTSTQMESYGQLTKIKKHNFVYPWFNYKFAIKSFDVDIEHEHTTRSGHLIVGFFLDSFSKSDTIKSIFKLLGSIVLQYNNLKSVIVYSFYGDGYSKYELQNAEDIIKYFSKPVQLKLFPINNSKAIQTMIHDNPGSDILFIPNIKNDCSIPASYFGSARINILSFNNSRFNLKYSYICKQSGGIFLTI